MNTPAPRRRAPFFAPPSPSLRCRARAALLYGALVAVVGVGGCKNDSAVAPDSTQTAVVVGSIAVTVSGLPAGAAGDVTVQGPGTYSHDVTKTTTLSQVSPGTYTVTARPIIVDGIPYAPTPASQTAVVGATAASAAASATVTYASRAGTLTVSVSGLPAGASASITVAGPNGFSKTLTATTTLTVAPGAYTLDAAAVSAGGTIYSASVAQHDVAVAANGTANDAVVYAPQQEVNADLTVAGMYIVQSVQTTSNTVPLVAGKDGVLRVFVQASQTLAAAPSVLARLYSNGQLVRTITIPAPSLSVPTGGAAESEGSLTTSWNALVDGSLIEPGLSVRVEVDPGNAIGETDETNNAYPAAGPAAVTVAVAPPYRVRFVPIAQPNNVVGNVTPSNVEQFLSATRRMHPVLDIDADVHETYTVSYSVTSDNRDGSWSKLLAEIDAKRVAEASDRDYYGVLETTYRSGVAGLGYVPGHAAIGWDYLTTGGASEVMAHEIGHNWNRLHSPCGGPSGVDPSYPYADGSIGSYGFDVTLGLGSANALKAPTTSDIMGYCSNKWISAYTYRAIQRYRESVAGAPSQGSAPGVATSADAIALGGGAAQPCLLVWGHVVNGESVLEPAFALTTRPAVPRPRRGGALTLRAKSATGATLWSRTFAGARIADTPNDDRTFAFAIPVSELHADAIASLQLQAGGRVATARVENAGTTAAAADSGAVRASPGAAAGAVRLRWDASRHPVLMVRDPRTGAVLAFARGGDATVHVGSPAARGAGVAAASDVDVALPNRLRGGWHRLRAGQ
ncbi:MAG TPA: CARDB domain-containing protein [Gemmatimonadaceae bacterium]|nr:CARDB domain-containing protein [Gemmatimonadaceae bacterium]